MTRRHESLGDTLVISLILSPFNRYERTLSGSLYSTTLMTLLLFYLLKLLMSASMYVTFWVRSRVRRMSLMIRYLMLLSLLMRRLYTRRS